MEMAAAAAVLPDDALAGVLRLLPPRSLAAARCVSRSWRHVVDDRRLLLQHLLPCSVGGFFLNYYDHETPHFLARPAPQVKPQAAAACGWPRRIDGRLSFVSARLMEAFLVLGHCNGLVLFLGGGMYLCNPATRWWARLPRRRGFYLHRAHVVFDPAASPPHWEVLLAPLKPHEEDDDEEHGDIFSEEEEEDGAWRVMEEEEEEHGKIFSEEDGGAWQVMEQEVQHGDISEEWYGGAWAWRVTEGEEEHYCKIFSEELEDGGWRVTEEEKEHGEIFSEELYGGDWRVTQEEEEEEKCEISEEVGAMEWPPATWTWRAVSSRTMSWEERVFVREGVAAGTVAGLKLHSDAPWHQGAYSQGALYIGCGSDHIAR